MQLDARFEPVIWPEDKQPREAAAYAQCEICTPKSRVIWGEGNPLAPVVVILDNPGTREDAHGNPYVCGTRQTLQEALYRSGLAADDMYVTYLLKCRPLRRYDKEAVRTVSKSFLMTMIKICNLEIENTKRVRAVKMEPAASGLTVIGGRNNQGKTSVIDAIAWALGGDRYRPTDPVRDGSAIPPTLHVTMSNGLVVERKGKNGELKFIDPDGRKGGQQLLNEFVEQLAIDLPRFMASSNKEKANTLLRIIGVGDQLYTLERKEQEIYNRRHAIGQIADQKRKFAAEMTHYPDAPADIVSVSALIQEQQAILAQNGENQRKREQFLLE